MAKRYGKRRNCKNYQGEMSGGGWANYVYRIEGSTANTYTRWSPWMLTNNWEYAMKWYNNPKQAWNRPTGNQRPKSSRYYIWMGKDTFQLVQQKGESTFHEKAQLVGRLMWGRYVDPECSRAMKMGNSRSTLLGIWQSTPTGDWRSAVYRDRNRSKNFHTWRKQMAKQRSSGILFYPTGPKNKTRLRAWTNVTYQRN